MSGMSRRITWTIEDHLCRHCGGRVLRSVSGAGLTPGGNPVYRCASCGKGGAHMGPGVVCWCGFGHRNQEPGAYECQPFSVIDQMPSVRQELVNLFRSCGCEPGDRSEVGIVTGAQWHELVRKATSQ